MQQVQDDDRGAVAVLVAAFTIIAMILFAFVIDRGYAYVQRNQVQNAADAAALAAAHALCATPAVARATVVSTAQNYATANGATLLDADVDIFDDGFSPEAGVSVAVNAVINNFFGGFVGNGSTAVAARATATRQCTSSFQFIAENFTNFNGGNTVGGNIYGGECFDGAGGSFQMVAVWRPITYNCPPPHNGATPIDPGSGGSVKVKEYSAPVQTPAAGFANAGYNRTYLDGLPYAGNCGSFSGADFLASGSPPAPLVCSGTGNSNADILDLSGDVNRGFVAEGDIDVAATNYTGSAATWIIYSKNGDIDITASLSDKAIVFAPNGTVTVNGSNTTVNGLVLAKNITFNGGNQQAGNSTTLRVPGPWRLSQ